MGHVVHMGYKSNHRVVVEKPEGKRPHGKLRRRWEDNCDMYVIEGHGGRH